MLWKEIEEKINRMINRVQTSVFGNITSVLKSDKTVFIKLSETEEIRDILIVSPSGLHSLPNPGKQGQAIFNNSNKKASLIGVDNNDVPIDIDIGEVILYNSIAKTYIHLKNDGNIYIKGQIINV